eukprot:5722206-Pyramimonas_sp.AAC.1
MEEKEEEAEVQEKDEEKEEPTSNGMSLWWLERADSTPCATASTNAAPRRAHASYYILLFSLLPLSRLFLAPLYPARSLLQPSPSNEDQYKEQEEAEVEAEAKTEAERAAAEAEEKEEDVAKGAAQNCVEDDDAAGASAEDADSGNDE